MLFIADFWPRVFAGRLLGKYLILHNDVNIESICRVNMTPALCKSHKSLAEGAKTDESADALFTDRVDCGLKQCVED